MLESKRVTQAANAFIFLIMVIISWSFKSSYFSYALILFALFLVMDGIYSARNHCAFCPKGTQSFYMMAAGIFIFYLIFNLTSILHWNQLDLTKSLDYTGLCFSFFIVWWILSKYDAEKGFRWGILAGAIIACIIGLHQWYMNPELRIESSYAHPNHFGTMINLTLPLIGYYALHIKDIAYKILSFCTMAMQLICLYLTLSRGALLALVGAAILGMLWTYFSLRKYSIANLGKYLCVLVVAVLISGGFSLYHMGQERHMEIAQMAESGHSIVRAGGERAQMIRASIAMWEDHKLMGVGAGHWGEEYYGTYRPRDIHEEGHSMPHNMPLFFLASGGVLGEAGYSVFIVFSVIVLTRIIKMRKDFCFGLMVCMVFLSFFIQGLVDTTIINKIPARMYFALMGSFISLCCLHLKKKVIEEN